MDRKKLSGWQKSVRARRRKRSAHEYIAKIAAGDRYVLSQAITLVESDSPRHKNLADEIVSGCLKIPQHNTMRIGITGTPGVGKSTFIDNFGLHLVDKGYKIAVLAVDPTSQHTKGSILGDKTRMEKLSRSDNAYIRPSPAGDSLGGVTRKTRESIILCEACKFDIIIVETVGVGQSETAVHGMVDFFLLLLLANSGDELQGIKRGIMEMADAIAINKADGENKAASEFAATRFQSSLDLFPQQYKWRPQVTTCSALTNSGIDNIWHIIEEHKELMRRHNFFHHKRHLQEKKWLHNLIVQKLKDDFYQHDKIKDILPDMERKVCDGNLLVTTAAKKLVDLHKTN
ncbi:methylmalonyl Co-A mutase-associated GTPase MeaB [Candidatus Uabimicrobium amorphum]|uniref:ATPase/protein kinase n=1 Tax=Uabimicrobium amorphum TaxID=2596890 RepID=A0A5S9IUU4_UABAM|nr:methylmalonyl Co-A mutase-associated GTPase MeaB [Candidatus Uabimicrobium amorphum]BBM87742.1 ATPase/protein kinase [Candidatus Uabimicrobium amorphum]